jgi:lactoylglutathione lyase
MKSIHVRRFGFAAVVVLAAAWAVGAGAGPARKSDFARTTIDVGIVVSDIEKSVDFYTKGLGFTELSGFDVPGDLGKDVGLTMGEPFHVHVLVLGDDESATKIKLMQFKESKGQPIDNAQIHSAYGMRYLTVFVKDADAAVKRAAEHGAQPLGKGLTPIPENIAPGMGLAVVRDPDGNMVELVGPRG